MQRTDSDHLHLARAIDLAERGLGRASPNPVVGAVIVRDGSVLGEGWHDEYGGPHAEVNAIADCGDADLRGATPVPFNFDWSFDYYPLAYTRPGPEMTIYRLRGGRCTPGGGA